jgi:hypothetical protein
MTWREQNLTDENRSSFRLLDWFRGRQIGSTRRYNGPHDIGYDGVSDSVFDERSTETDQGYSKHDGDER